MHAETARRLKPYRIGWFEEPTLPKSLDVLRAVREQVAVPITVGERPYARRLEHHVANVPWYDRPLDLRGDQVHVSARPRLGVELDPAFLRTHPARGWTG